MRSPAARPAAWSTWLAGTRRRPGWTAPNGNTCCSMTTQRQGPRRGVQASAAAPQPREPAPSGERALTLALTLAAGDPA